MFFLAHVPGRHIAGRLAVWLIPAGVTLMSPGLLTGADPLAWAGAVILAAGLAGHLASMAAHLRHRRRKGGLHVTFVVTAAGFLIAGAGLSLAAAIVMPRDHDAGMALAAAAVTAFGGWLLEAVAGHAHKVVPFIVWSALRGRGITTGPSGRPLGFGDLYAHRVAAATYALVTAGSPRYAPGSPPRSPPRSRLAAGCSPRRARGGREPVGHARVALQVRSEKPAAWRPTAAAWRPTEADGVTITRTEAYETMRAHRRHAHPASRMPRNSAARALMPVRAPNTASAAELRARACNAAVIPETATMMSFTTSVVS
jgi:hypothetical protein